MSPRRIAATGFANYFFLFVSYAILSPYLQLYLKARGFSLSRIGVLLGILELAGVAGPIVIGRLADSRVVYRTPLAACLLLPALLFVPLQLTASFPVCVACIALMGFTYRSAIPLLDSNVSRTLPDFARQYGPLRVAGSLGFIGISLFLQFGGVVSADSPLSIAIVFGASALIAAGAAGLLPSVAEVPAPRRDPRHGPGHDGFDLKFWAVIGLVFLGRFAMGSYYSFFSLYLRETFPSSGVSLLWAIGPLAEIPTIWFSGPLIRRWGIRGMLAVALAAISIRLALFVVVPSIAVLALTQLLHAFTFGTFHTTAITYVNAKIGHERRGMGMALYNAVGVGLATFLASTAGGYILEAKGFTSLFLLYAAIPLAGLLVLALFGKRLIPQDGRA